jgi:CHAT domain-containing protein
VLDDFGVAEERFLEARAIEQDAGRGRGQQMGFIQNNLGEVYLATGRHHEAAVCLLKAAAIRRARFGRDSSQHLRTVSSLVTLAGERRQFGRARRLIRLTLPRLESIGEGFNRASFEFRLAALDVNEDPAPEPLARLRAAVESIVATDGDETMTSADALLQVAFAHVGGGDWDNARAYAARATHAADMALLEFLTAGSREQVAKWADHVRRGQDLFVSLVAGRRATAPADLENAYSCVLRRKALETRALLLGKPGLDGTGFNPDRYRTIVDAMVALRRTLVRLQIEGDAASGPGHAESDMRAVRRQLAEREMQLAQTIPDKSLEWEILETSHEVVAASLPPETVAVEYVRYRDVARSEPASGEPSPSRYAAFVVRSAGVELIHDSRVHFSGFNPFAAFARPGDVKPPVVYDLGDAGEIDAEIRRFRDALIEGSTSSTRIPQWIRRGRFLYNRLVKPLAHELGGVKHVYLAPDGALNVLPFELLATGEASADGAERLLVDALSEADVSYMLYGRELAGFLGHVAIKKNALVIAAPNFDFDGSGAPAANGGVFVELPGTRAEGAAVAARIESIAVTGDEAVEARLLQSAAADIIHIATHGIYLEPPPQAPAAAPSTLEFDDRLKRRARLADPMERSGLVFAGANAVLAGLAVPPAAGDGIVFASEIVDLDLRATDLVVLSACQTAIGDVRTGDGVQGLRRAFAGAGCRSLVCALWRIPDQISASWMETFYDALMQQQSKSAALATARARLRAQYPGQPAYWGGFILTGDPKPLRRFDPLSDLTVASISMKGLFDRNGDAPRSRTPAEEIEARYNAGREKLRQGDVDAAIQLFTEALGIADGPEASRALAFYQRAGAYRRQRQFEAALQDYATMLAMPLPDRLAMSARFDRGTTLSLSGDYAGAIGEYSTVLATSGLEPGDRVQALVNRGSTYAMAGDDASAIQDFSAVIDTAGSDRVQRFKALVNRASLFLHMARYADAIADADVALSLGLGEAAGIERAQNLRARAAQLLKSSGETV